ncbi:MAG: indolepyruvate oxidoreductase subunit beta [Synergistaceae bacterium]|jgi:indolepyruvate ferredoxin oxidoreductase beta subunit|nr:indolepyruvate oxidoreductase subunit beta [Synergistaceae bacterium]
MTDGAVKSENRLGAAGGTKSILLVGVGGQGTILASKILSEGLMRAGHDVKMSEIHGMSQRGGSVTTHVKFGPKVYSPIINEREADILVAFEKAEAVRWLGYLRLGGALVVNDYEIHPLSVLTGEAAYPAGVIEMLKAEVPNMIEFDAGRIASGLGDVKAQNVVLLGALIQGMGLGGIDWEGVLADLVPPKLLDLNVRAFKAGAARFEGADTNLKSKA